MSDDVEKQREAAEAADRKKSLLLASNPRPKLPGDEDGDGIPDTEEGK